MLYNINEKTSFMTGEDIKTMFGNIGKQMDVINDTDKDCHLCGEPYTMTDDSGNKICDKHIQD